MAFRDFFDRIADIEKRLRAVEGRVAYRQAEQPGVLMLQVDGLSEVASSSAPGPEQKVGLVCGPDGRWRTEETEHGGNLDT